MPSHAHKVIPINIKHRSETAEAFSALAAAAERGEITGAVYVVIDENGRPHQGVVGSAATAPEIAYYGLARLTDLLLWPAEFRKKR